jgi:hypothetical protein
MLGARLAERLGIRTSWVYELVQQFVQMLRTRTGAQLDGWLERVKASQIRELQGFVAGVVSIKQ